MYRLSLVMLVLGAISNAALAGGGGQNMLLIVNPNDENSLRIATAYQKLRNIPDSNVMFIVPPQRFGYDNFDVSDTELRNTYLTPIANYISSKGLTGQIDYIGTVGEALKSGNLAATFALYNMDQVRASTNTLSTYEWTSNPTYQAGSYTLGANTAIHHSTVYNGKSYYMAGAISYTGTLSSCTAAQAIASLTASVAADGAKPAGKIYLEYNPGAIRVDTRSGQYAAVEAALTARGISYVEYDGRIIETPKNAPDIRGLTMGAGVFNTKLGSTYQAGSFADCLTSGGMDDGYYTQDRCTKFLAAGVSLTAGTVREPYAIAARFPHTMIHVISADGSTLGEAFYKSIQTPDLCMPVGDMLAQPYADLPRITLTAAPSNGQQVSGSITVSTSAVVTPSATTTGVAKQELWIDGKLSQTITGDSGSFTLNTTTISDGRHELRVVAYNNSSAQSQNYVIRNVTVNNVGRSASPATTSVTLNATQVGTIGVTATPGNGTIQKIELRQMGRTLSSVTGSGATANLSIDAKKLAYGDNTIIPVVTYTDGKEVAGNPVTVSRNTPALLAGQTPLATELRSPGIKAEYFVKGSSVTLAGMNFQGTPDRVDRYKNIMFGTNGNKFYSIPSGYDTYNTVDPIVPSAGTANGTTVGVRLTGRFIVDSANTGQYDFFINGFGSSDRMSIDGIVLAQYDGGTWCPDTCQSTIFLGSGEHMFDIDISSVAVYYGGNGRNTYYNGFFMRGPDGNCVEITDAFVYSNMVPEPASMALLCLGAMGLLRIRRKR